VKVGGWVEGRDNVGAQALKREAMWRGSGPLGGRKASARISTFLGALAPLGAKRQVCNKQVSIKELFIVLWAIMHFSHE